MTLFKPFFPGKEILSSEMSIFFEILVRIASYGPQIDQSHGENRRSHMTINTYWIRLGYIIIWRIMETLQDNSK